MTTYETGFAKPVRDTKTPKEIATALGQALFGTELRVLVFILALVAAWGLAIATWGYPALIIVALALVPVMFTVMLMITVGK